METMRLGLAATVVMALLSGASGPVLAQATDEAALDPMRPSHFTMTSTEDISDSGEFTWGPGPGYGQSLGNESVALMEATDPRIGGTWTQVLDIRAFPIDEQAGDFALVWSGVVRIENEDGAWAGTLDGYHSGTLGREWNRLEGEGAYEGLTAVFRWIEEDDAYEGVIIHGDPPDYPAAIVAGSMAPGDESMEQAPAEAESSEEEASATADHGDDGLSGTATYIDGLRTWQYWDGDDTIYKLEMSDPRANGTYTEFNFVGDGYKGGSQRPSEAALGHATLVNDQGSWAGLESAVWDDDMGWRLTAWLAGEGAYEGLTLYLHAHRFPVYSTPEMDFDGIIFEGEPPVMLEAFTFPAE